MREVDLSLSTPRRMVLGVVVLLAVFFAGVYFQSSKVNDSLVGSAVMESLCDDSLSVAVGFAVNEPGYDDSVVTYEVTLRDENHVLLEGAKEYTAVISEGDVLDFGNNDLKFKSDRIGAIDFDIIDVKSNVGGKLSLRANEDRKSVTVKRNQCLKVNFNFEREN